MANYQFSSDIVNDALFRAGEPTDSTSDYDTVALQYVNRGYRALWMGGGEFDPTINEKWWWLQTEASLILLPVENTGTINVTNNSASITFSTGPTPSVAGYHFKVNDHADVFKISSHTAGATAATLDSVYTGPTNTAANFKAFKLEYDLTDGLGLIEPIKAYQDDRVKITSMSLGELNRQFPLNQTEAGVPRHFAFTDEDTIRFQRYGGTSSTDFIRLDYQYLQRPSDLTDSGSEESLVPKQYRHILADMALFYLLLDKDDSRAEAIGAMAKSGIKAMRIENRNRWQQQGEIGQILPRQQDVITSRGPLRTETGLIIG
jgi:hypothetical protein